MKNCKFVTAKQAKPFYNYKNTKEKLLKASSGVWFNKICIIQANTQVHKYTDKILVHELVK
jgi:hypothetical protein